MTSNTPTDLPCQSNQTFAKDIIGSPVSKINFSDAVKEKLSKKRIREMPVSPTFQEKNDFSSELQSVQPKTAALHLLKEYDKEYLHRICCCIKITSIHETIF